MLLERIFSMYLLERDSICIMFKEMSVRKGINRVLSVRWGFYST